MPLIPKDDVHICAVHKICMHSMSCVHSLTHLRHHCACYKSKGFRLCSDFKLAQAHKSYLSHELPNVYLYSSSVKCGWCIPWTYYMTHMTDERHILFYTLTLDLIDPRTSPYPWNHVYQPVEDWKFRNGSYINTVTGEERR